MGAADRLIKQLKDEKKKAKDRGDWGKVSRIDDKLKSAESHKDAWFS